MQSSRKEKGLKPRSRGKSPCATTTAASASVPLPPPIEREPLVTTPAQVVPFSLLKFSSTNIR